MYASVQRLDSLFRFLFFRALFLIQLRARIYRHKLPYEPSAERQLWIFDTMSNLQNKAITRVRRDDVWHYDFVTAQTLRKTLSSNFAACDTHRPDKT